MMMARVLPWHAQGVLPLTGSDREHIWISCRIKDDGFKHGCTDTESLCWAKHAGELGLREHHMGACGYKRRRRCRHWLEDGTPRNSVALRCAIPVCRCSQRRDMSDGTFLLMDERKTKSDVVPSTYGLSTKQSSISRGARVKRNRRTGQLSKSLRLGNIALSTIVKCRTILASHEEKKKRQ